MSWLKRIHPITLHQASDIPFVILEDGVHLCFSNLYDEENEKTEHHIIFQANRKDIIRYSTNYFRFLKFPVTIPFASIISCDDFIVGGRLIKHAVEQTVDSKDIVIAKSNSLRDIEDEHFQKLADIMADSDHAFVLVDDDIDPQIRILNDVAKMLHHNGDWGRTCVAIANSIHSIGHRKYCWTKSLPEMNVVCYGLKGNDMEQIQNTFDFIGINCSVSWEE